MIKEILELLETTSSKDEVVQLAKGKNKYPETVGEAITRFKNEVKWLKK